MARNGYDLIVRRSGLSAMSCAYPTLRAAREAVALFEQPDVTYQIETPAGRVHTGYGKNYDPTWIAPR